MIDIHQNHSGPLGKIPWRARVRENRCKLSTKLVFLGNGILVILFFDIGKWPFVLTLKSRLNNVLRVMFTLRDRRIMRENCFVRVRKSVFSSYIPQGNLKRGYGLAYSLTKVPKLKQVV